jgi:hypothetical protein
VAVDEDHGSPLRRLRGQSADHPYVSIHSLQEAKAHRDGCVILYGDDGGQIYLAAPASAVTCDEATLNVLLGDLDSIAWPDNDDNSARIVYEPRATGVAVAGGMGGGTVTPTGWIHAMFVDLGLEAEIRDVLHGGRQRLSTSSRDLRR